MPELFVISSRKINLERDATQDVYFRKIAIKMGYCNTIVIQSKLICKDMTESIINDLIRIGGWIIEYEKQRELTITNPKNETYNLKVIEYKLKRTIHNQLD